MCVSEGESSVSLCDIFGRDCYYLRLIFMQFTNKQNLHDNQVMFP